VPVAEEYALASHVRHPGNVYLPEAGILAAIDNWLSVIFAPHRLTWTIREMESAQSSAPAGAAPKPGQDTRAAIADCDARLARYQAALDAGADPQTVAEWGRQVKADRVAALARDASHARSHPGPRLTQDDMSAIITSLDDLRHVIRDAGPRHAARRRGISPARRPAPSPRTVTSWLLTRPATSQPTTTPPSTRSPPAATRSPPPAR
jgi:hypothetical protein